MDLLLRSGNSNELKLEGLNDDRRPVFCRWFSILIFCLKPGISQKWNFFGSPALKVFV